MASVLKSPKITKRAVDAFKPAERERVVWDDDITGFGVRVHPSGAKAFLVNYRAGNGGRKAPIKRVVAGRAGRMTPDQARRRAQELLGRVATGEDPAGERAEARGLPRLGEACEVYIKSGHGYMPRSKRLLRPSLDHRETTCLRLDTHATTRGDHPIGMSLALGQIFTARLWSHFARFSIAASSQTSGPLFTSRLFRKSTL